MSVLPLLVPSFPLRMVHSSIAPNGLTNCRTSSSVCCLLSIPMKSLRSSEKEDRELNSYFLLEKVAAANSSILLFLKKGFSSSASRYVDIANCLFPHFGSNFRKGALKEEERKKKLSFFPFFLLLVCLPNEILFECLR